MDLVCCWLPLVSERKKANCVDHLLLVFAGRKKEELLQVVGLLLKVLVERRTQEEVCWLLDLTCCLPIWRKKKKEDSHWGLLARWREIDARSSGSFFFIIGRSYKKTDPHHIYINFETTFKYQDHIFSRTEVVTSL